MVDEPKSGLGVDRFGGPVIDPTENVRELVIAAIQRQDDLRLGQAALFKACLDGLEKRISERLEGHERHTDAKFDSVNHEFEMVESRRMEQKIDTKTAVDAALSAAEKAVREQALASEKAISKSENGAAEQFKQQRETTSAQLKSVETGVADLKERIGKLETAQQTKSETRTDTRLNVGMVVGILGSVFAFVMIAVVIIIAVLRAS